MRSVLGVREEVVRELTCACVSAADAGLADVHLIMLDVQRGHLPPGNNATPATLFPKAPNGSCSFACSGRTIPIP